MINCIALDDEPLALEIIENFCKEVSYLSLKKTFTNPSEAADYLGKNNIDLLFCDIQMPEVNGIQFCEQLEEKPILIFTTAFSEYAVQGYDLNAIDYLLKPFSFERFLTATNKAIDYYTFILKSLEDKKDYIFVRSYYNLVKISINDILYIEAMDDYIKIFCEGKRPIITKLTMKKIMDELPQNRFSRVHRSFIVSMDKIESVRNKVIKIKDNEIPIGNNYQKELSHWI